MMHAQEINESALDDFINGLVNDQETVGKQN
jgi:hypothetical protein